MEKSLNCLTASPQWLDFMTNIRARAREGLLIDSRLSLWAQPINGKSINLSQKYNGEHQYTPNNDNDEKHRQILADSLSYDNQQYYVGLRCRCCVGDEKCDQLRQQSQQQEDRLTWANLFVNANYSVFLEETIPVIQSRKINIICHEKAQLDDLPFEVCHDFRIGSNAWVNNYQDTLKEIQGHIVDCPLFHAIVASNDWKWRCGLLAGIGQ